MKLLLKRIALRDTYTIGKLYINGTYFCNTLEDKVRDNNKDGDLDDDGEGKVYGETAIPYGTYKIILNYSPKFKRTMPRLLNVKHFVGILMHNGTTAKHTFGCILVGKNTIVGQLTDSKAIFERLFEILQEAQEEITITII
jgi:hypothetical protein